MVVVEIAKRTRERMPLDEIERISMRMRNILESGRTVSNPLGKRALYAFCEIPCTWQ
jgi:hypothetical protein